MLYLARMKLEDAAGQVARVDLAFRAGAPISDEDSRLVLTKLYNDLDWGGPDATPLPPAAAKALVLDDMTADARWSKHFAASRREIGLYRSRAGCYWLLTHDPLAKQHTLSRVGTAADALTRFGSGG